MVSKSSIHRHLKREGFTAFHEVPQTLKTAKNRDDRLWFVEFLREWDEEDFLHVAASDEFFIYTLRKPNFVNDRIWARSLADVAVEERFRNCVKHPKCVGIFLLMTSKRLMWIIKQHGESWDAEYFRKQVIPDVTNFLTDPGNVISVDDVVLLHDKAPGWTANRTQAMLEDSPIDFLRKNEYPDLNVVENLGSIVKEHVEVRMLAENGKGRYSQAALIRNLQSVLAELAENNELFEDLLLSYPKRLQAVQLAGGSHTSY